MKTAATGTQWAQGAISAIRLLLYSLKQRRKSFMLFSDNTKMKHVNNLMGIGKQSSGSSMWPNILIRFSIGNLSAKHYVN